MRRTVCLFLAFAGSAFFSAAYAEDGVQLDPPPARPGVCVEVEVGGEQVTSLECLTQGLRKKIDDAQAVPKIQAPANASSPSVEVGGFNLPALSQQYGKNLGKSVHPYRPPQPNYVQPLGR
ncbi:hypothetical protein ACSHT0_16090 [Tepidicaulis sp. LMO-SS28]|uniref:hypothetical protein n=1 Tax=Tepidicaulis sp. LMO-SS28 TaxID=3447455 RepID=UPI003EE1776C